MTKDPINLNKEKELKRMQLHAHKALMELTQADYISCELSNRNLLDYHVNSTMAKLFYNALERIREVNAYLEGVVGN